ncbi:MAG: thiamine biosynthesis protein ApbE [Burkholderiales bacterium PBB3]|nr:MAG: thiamine biosynthesis protein ApbE [Burkholderiales bacterium PBB3]
MRAHSFSFQAMASACELRVVAADAATAERAAQAAMAEVRRIEATYSRYQSASIVSRINANAGGDWVECDAETLTLLAYAETLFNASGGLFDITSGILRQAWNFKEARVADPAQLADLYARIGWQHVERDGNQVRLPQAGMELDFGGFGKEYAADRAAAALLGQGITSGYVNLAGDVHVLGPKPDGAPWGIGIQHPRDPRKIVATIPIHKGGLATSGDYERYFEKDGKRYCHILNPHTGMPVTHWQSVSVLAATALTAGSLCTIAMLKEGDGLAFLDQAGAVYLAIDAEGLAHRRDSRSPAADQSAR